MKSSATGVKNIFLSIILGLFAISFLYGFVEQIRSSFFSEPTSVSSTEQQTEKETPQKEESLTYINPDGLFSFSYPSIFTYREEEPNTTIFEITALPATSSIYYFFRVSTVNNDLEQLQKNIEGSDKIANGDTLAPIKYIEEKNINERTVTFGSYGTALGIDNNFVFIPLKNTSTKAIYIEYQEVQPQ